jgi:hypothetical protein
LGQCPLDQSTDHLSCEPLPLKLWQDRIADFDCSVLWRSQETATRDQHVRLAGYPTHKPVPVEPADLIGGSLQLLEKPGQGICEQVGRPIGGNSGVEQCGEDGSIGDLSAGQISSPRNETHTGSREHCSSLLRTAVE